MARPPGRLTVMRSLPGRARYRLALHPRTDRWRPPPSIGFAPWTSSPSASPWWRSPSRSPSPRSTARSRRRWRRRSPAGICSGCGARSRASRTAPGTVTWTWSTPTHGAGRDTPVLKVNCWGRTWGPLKTSARSPGHRPRARRGGVLAGPRRVLPAQGPGQFHRRRRRRHRPPGPAGGAPAPRCSTPSRPRASSVATRPWPCPPCRLRVGLVASPGSEGYNDFVGQLQASDIAFSVVLVPRQRPRDRGAGLGGPGPRAPWRALTATSPSSCAAAALAAISPPSTPSPWPAPSPPCRCRLWTGIGHTGDQSVADIVAHRAFVTPTACAQELVRRVGEWWESVIRSGEQVGRRAVAALEAATHRRRHGAPPLEHRHPPPALPALRAARAPGGPRLGQRPPPARCRRRLRGAPGATVSALGRSPCSTGNTTSSARGDACWPPTTSSDSSNGATRSRCGPTAPWCDRRRDSRPEPR